ncbi:WD_REPEATS_REGION domain-containing protein [Psidium guajava]|nr:WD_REPEATS_REGION domain-containing protein [Psidium guajava]
MEARYLNSCNRHQTQPNAEVVSWFSKAKTEMTSCGGCHIVISLDHLQDTDLLPLIDVFMEIHSFDVDTVDVVHNSPHLLNSEHLIGLMHAIGDKLHAVNLQDSSLGEEFLSNLNKSGVSCEVFSFWSLQIQKLNMVGRFTQLHTLNLDFCTSVTSFHKDCFSGMPNLMRLSMCETRVANLWTTTAVLSKLPYLVELRFQKCLCCHDTGPCASLYSEKENLLDGEKSGSVLPNCRSYKAVQSVSHGSSMHKVLDEIEQIIDKEFVFLCAQKLNLRNGSATFKKYVSHHCSPICYEKYYREYMIVCLPRLEVLDNLPVQEVDKEVAKNVFSSHYENLPYGRQHKESVIAVLHQREMGKVSFYHPKSIKLKHSVSSRTGQQFFSRSLTAAKLGSSVWPLMQPVSQVSHLIKEEGTQLRPRQFEYNPSDPSLMAFGTLDGEIIITNHEGGNIVGYVPSTGVENSILGLCWLKKYPSKLIAGSDNGSLKLFDINCIPPKVSDFSFSYDAVTFDDFEQLTSVHVNSMDDRLLVSGYTRNIALYDIATGKRMELFRDLHREPINVAKFANHSPFLFATSSFDRDVKMWDLRETPVRPCYTASSSRENVMVCFSPDDHYLLVSAVDNEVKQLLAGDGRIQMKFEIASTGSAHNYTRSYYMNGRDYVISGSCDEHVVRICCAQTGRRLRDVVLEDGNSGNSMYVQSLRGDPFRDFHFSVLAALTRSSAKCEIMKVNLLASIDQVKDHPYNQSFRPSYSLGG